ncbi:metallophosphoesterase [bacterium]|nr:metallophosphoesterase [bacterium]
MKMGIFADTHDNLPMVKKAVSFFNLKEVDLVLHLGDFVSPFFLSAINDLKAGFIGVFGNNDGDKLMLQMKFRERGLELFNPPYTIKRNAGKILMMHEPFELDALIKSGEYMIISYAHTHIPRMKMEKSTLVVNPGECGGWLYGKSTVAYVDVDSLKGEIYEL